MQHLGPGLLSLLLVDELHEDTLVLQQHNNLHQGVRLVRIIIVWMIKWCALLPARGGRWVSWTGVSCLDGTSPGELRHNSETLQLRRNLKLTFDTFSIKSRKFRSKV